MSRCVRATGEACFVQQQVFASVPVRAECPASLVQGLQFQVVISQSEAALDTRTTSSPLRSLSK